MVEVQKLSSILAAQLCTKIRAKRWQAFMKSLNLFIYYEISLYIYFNKFPTLQFLILNISAVASAIKRIFRMLVSELMK